MGALPCPVLIASAVQAFAGDIQGYGYPALVLAHLNANIRVFGIYIGALALNPANAVNHRIFDPLGAIHGVVDEARGAYKVDGDALCCRKSGSPREYR